MVFGMSEIKSDNPDDIKDFHQKVENFLDHVFKEKIDPEIEKGYKELGSILNVYEDHHLVMKREKINSLSLFVGKKKYILNTLNSEGVHFNTPKISVTGIESVRSSTPEVCRNKMKDLFSIIMSNDESKAQEFINEFWEEFRQLPPEEIAKNSGTGDLNLYIDKKNIYTKSCPIHFRGALLYNEFLKKKGLEKIYPEIISGDKIKFVYLKMPNPIRENVISFQEKIPDEFNLKDYIDYETQFEKVFVKPIQNIFDAVSWTTEKIDTLEDFFS
jgi:DNA polymerase elongation subunit (family B)